MGGTGASKDIGLLGFLLGAVAGTVATLALNTYRRSEERAPPPYDEEGQVAEEPLDESVNDGGDDESNGSSESSGKEEHHRRNASFHSDASSVFSRRSFTITEEETSLRSNCSKRVSYADNPESGSNYEVITEEDLQADDEIIKQTREFDEHILTKLSNTEELQLLLRRTRAINSLAHTLTVAKDEKCCFEEVSRLIVPLFKIDGCAFALLKDSDHVIFKHITSSKHEYVVKLGLESGPDGLVKPLKETAAALVATTLKQHYCPRTKESSYPAQRMVHLIGLNTILVTPIVVNNGDQFAGCILTFMEKEDGFSEADRILMNNVASMLGASIYSKRLRLAAEISNKISREMLHSMIPGKVLDKIECFWDDTSSEYQSRRASSFVDSVGSSLGDSDRMFLEDGYEFDLEEDERDMNANNSMQRRKKERSRATRQSISAKISLFNEMNKSEPHMGHVGVVIDTSAMELHSTHRALYAETIPDVCIIFTDIVNFSQIALDMNPIKVMDMLQDLFSRFDALCDRFGVQKLETIGDAYIATTGMFDEGLAKNIPNACANALGMAKEMVREAKRVFIPKKNKIQALEIRVGIHIGEITAGVLGERLPKFTVFGTAVNMSARMEQTCLPSMIRVTKDFYDQISEQEEWEEKEIIHVKNMGEVETYLLNPLS